VDAPIQRTAREVCGRHRWGARFLPGPEPSFRCVGSASQTLRREAAPKTVHIATLPALAQFVVVAAPALKCARRTRYTNLDQPSKTAKP